MAAEQYFVVLDNSKWKIGFKDKHYGSYDTEDEAVEAAIDTAYAMSEIGINTQVLHQDTDEKLSAVWSSDQDFYTTIR